MSLVRKIKSSFLNVNYSVTVVLILAGCVSSQKVKVAPITSQMEYKVAFNKIKDYIKLCLPGAKMTANLFTDKPFAEVVVDDIPAAMMIGYVSTYEARRELINIQIQSRGKGSEIKANSPSAKNIAQQALSDKPCPRK